MGEYTSVSEMFLRRVAETPSRDAFIYPKGEQWLTLTWKEVGEKVRALASGLRALGLEGEQRVAIMSTTRVEWVLADMAILTGGGATTTVYTATTPEDCAYILNDSATVMAFVEDKKALDKLASVREQIPSLKKVVVIDGAGGHDGWAISWAELAEKGAAHDKANPDDYERIAKAVKGDSLATLIYTSGTTGKPKGVELTHSNWVYEGKAMSELGLLSVDDVQYLWLPLAHSFGKVLECGQLYIGFCSGIDGRVDKILDGLAAVKPTFVAAVPRIFEKVHAKIVGPAKNAGGLKWKIFQWAVGVGAEVSKEVQAGRQPTGFLEFKYDIATKLVFSKIHARFGGRLKYFVSGSAPLARELAEFFHGAGVYILEGYGLTESSAATFVNRPKAYRLGTVGLPMNGTEVKIADDGEILLKGPGIMRGYHNLPEQTAEALDAEGYLHTGDIGQVEEGGFLRITDRKKELIKTSGGKYVAPTSLEGRLKAFSPLIGQVLVHGNNRNFCTALITLDADLTRAWAAANDVAETDLAALAKNDKVRAHLQGAVDQLNATLARFETIKKFAVLPTEFSIETGELTPSLKMKRKVIEGRHKEILDGFYEGADAAKGD
ncbi:MAG: long-chain fatty acid--CoA ligase [Polyangiales bacterium]